jgi:superfamily II DNA or RNA helicase
MLDLFAHNVTIELPSRYHLRGRIAGNRLLQMACPPERCDLKVAPRQIRDRSYLVGEKTDGQRIAFLPRSLQLPKDCHDGVIIGDAGSHDDLFTALKHAKARWHGEKPIDPAALSIEQCQEFHQVVRGSWGNALRLVAERYENEQLVQTGLRPPQIGAIHAVKAHWIVSEDPATIVMPTGTGKTETMLSLLISEPIERLLVVVPSDALRTQLGMKFVDLGVLKKMGCLEDSAAYPIVALMKRAPKTAEELDALFLRAQVIVTTMPSLSRLSAELQARIAEHVSHLFVDEAHHIAAATWKALKGRFTQRKRRIIQFTATPYRNDDRRVDGKLIFSYPLRRAQADKLFTPITYEPIFEARQDRADLAIVRKVGEILKRDEEAGHVHLAMARTDSIERAEDLLRLYHEQLSHYPSALVHNRTPPLERAAIIEDLRGGRIRIVVCVNMLGEGFDLPRLKIAGLHDKQASETITLQFIGRFTRNQVDLGSATVIAAVSLKDPREWLNALYKEDADWNYLLHVRSAYKTDRQRRREGFYLGLDAHFESVPQEAITPKLSTYVYRTRCQRWNPDDLVRMEKGRALIVEEPIVHQELSLVMMVMRHETRLRWARLNSPSDVVYNLILAHWDSDRSLLYVHSSTMDGIHLEVAKILAGGDVEVLGGEAVFRVLHGYRRVLLSNLGVKETDVRPVRFQLSSGIDITAQLEALADNRTRVKTNLYGTGFVDEPLFPDDDDEIVEPTRRGIGCSVKGKVYSHDVAIHPGEWRDWCRQIGPKIADETLTTEMVLRNVMRPKRQPSRPPEKVPIGIDWPEGLSLIDEDRVDILFGDLSVPMSECDLAIADFSDCGPILFHISSEIGKAAFAFDIRDGSATFSQRGTPTVRMRRGERVRPLVDVFKEDPPTIRFTDGSVLMGADLAEAPGDDVPYFDLAAMDGLDWKGVDITKESQGPDRLSGTIQRAVIERLRMSEVPYDLIFDGDGCGEVADVVAIRRQGRSLDVDLFHCKYSTQPTAGARLDDLYPVCGQAMKSVRWASPRSRFLQQLRRQEENRQAQGGTRFEIGNRTLLDDWLTNRRDFVTRFNVTVVQPGYSKARAQQAHLPIIGSVRAYLQATYGIGFRFWASP